MKIVPNIYTADRKIPGTRLRSLGYVHLDPGYTYRIGLVPGHPRQKLLLTYRYANMEDRCDLTVVDRDLHRLSGPLICLGPNLVLYGHWLPALLREAERTLENRRLCREVNWDDPLF